MSDADIIRGAKATLAQACLQAGFQPTSESLTWMLGLVWGESRFGQSPDWVIPNDLNTTATNPTAPPGPSNNWGACRQRGSQGFIMHHDRDAQGNLGTYPFARFDTQLQGAANFLATLNRGGATAVLSGKGPSGGASTPHDLAAAMYANHYYTGVKGTDDDRINAYANMIIAGAAKVRSAEGAPATVTPNTPGKATGPVFVTATDEDNAVAWPLMAAGGFAVGTVMLLAWANVNPNGLGSRAIDHAYDVTHDFFKGLGRSARRLI